MKTSAVKFNFPMLGFTPDQEIWGFQDLNTLTACGPRTLKENLQIGMEVVDGDGRRWVVRSIHRTGRGQPLAAWLLSFLVSTPQSRIEQELDELSPISLSEIKERACSSVEATSSDYCAEDERKEVLLPLLNRVRSAGSVREIHELLGLDSFMDY
jgi:hypothetical protein